MKKHKSVKARIRGFTLIECVMALALGALILAPLSRVFSVSRKSWEYANRRSEMIMALRYIMMRMSYELRYAVALKDGGLPREEILFYTRQFKDQDWECEGERYAKSFTSLIYYPNIIAAQAPPDPAIPYQILASGQGRVQLAAFDIIGLKLGGSGNLVECATGFQKDAVAVKVDITVQHADTGETMRAATVVKLRG